MKQIPEPIPCPFCGRADKLAIDDRELYETLLANHGSASLQVQCNVCNCYMTAYSWEFDDPGDYDTMAARLIERWNTRKGAHHGEDSRCHADGR